MGSARSLDQDSQVWPSANVKYAEVDGGQAHWADCLKQDLQVFFGIFRMAAFLLALERSYERLREIARVYECWADCLKQDLQDFLEFSGWWGPCCTSALVRVNDERWRAFTRDHESLRVLGGLSEAGFAGFFGIFRMAALLLTLERSYERLTRDHESLRVLGGLSEAGLAGFFGIFRMAGAMLAQVSSYERWTRDHERLRQVF